jgi:thiamine pyrophosphate-dependent acetolactate synthase large subunit-like protein
VTGAQATGADSVATALRSAGCEVAFGLPGVHNLSLWPALARAGIRVVGTRHEQSAAFAADGYARVTGRPGVALVTTGPGAANTLGAVGEAWASRSPLVVIATDVATSLRRPDVFRGSLHESSDQAALFRPLTKATLEVPDPDGLPMAVLVGLTLATAAPSRPVYIGIPNDLLAGPAPIVDLPGADPEPLVPDPVPLAQAARLLEKSKRPLLWVGGGARDASDAVRRVATCLGAPVVTTFQGRGVLPASHPSLVAAPPHEPAVTALLEEADACVLAGTDLDGPNTQNWKLPVPRTRIAVNVDAVDAAKNYPVDVVVEADAVLALEALSERLGPDGRPPWADVAAVEAAARADVLADDGGPTGLAFVEHTMEGAGEDALVFVDMTVPGYWLAGYARVERVRSLHYPMGWGTLGFAFPAAIGAVAETRSGSGRPVVAVCGDGGFLYAPGELATVVQEDLPLTVVVVDDGGYGMLRYGHAPEEWPQLGTELHSPDFAALAQSFGVDARSVDGVGEDYRRALRDAIASPRPVLIHLRAVMQPPRTTSPRWPLRV